MRLSVRPQLQTWIRDRLLIELELSGADTGADAGADNGADTVADGTRVKWC